MCQATSRSQVSTSSAAYQAPRAIESVHLARLPIGEGGVDKIRVRHAVDELAAVDSLRSALLGEQALAGRPLDLGERGGVGG